MTDASGSPGEESKTDRTDTRRPDRVAAGESGTTRRTALKAGAVTAATAALAGCSALLGGGDDDSGEAADVGTDQLEAGLLTFTQGAASVLGIQAQRGAEKAVERINEAGGVAGQREVSLEVVDETESPTDDYQQFINDGKDVTFGPVSSGTHESIAPDIETNEVVNVATDGTVTTLYEETNPNPTYSFRFQNYDVMEATTAALEVVERLDAAEIDTYAGVNPDYTFGRDEMEVFSLAIEGITGAEEVYSGFPALGESDFSTYISRINDEEPDVVFSSCWGGDASNFLSQAFQRNMFDNVDVVVGPVFYGSANAIDEEVVTGTDRGTILAGSRNGLGDGRREGHRDRRRLPEPGADRDDPRRARLLHAGGLSQRLCGPHGPEQRLRRRDGVGRRSRRAGAHGCQRLPEYTDLAAADGNRLREHRDGLAELVGLSRSIWSSRLSSESGVRARRVP